MPTPQERLCCRRGLDEGECILHNEESGLSLTVLNQHVVQTAVSAARDLYAEDMKSAYNNDQMRHQAYKQYVYGTAGRTGSGNRVVVPSCVVSKCFYNTLLPHSK
jgi:hypothetical protein